ncbi:tRNA uridine(34) 5-carboxymethylaminomethyl modification radical SAM/GNAT enzyme Elp3 [Candidatus Woesearchaeota archaeon]|nr:tRNA uridine(34) 5-carboxymethylaminomethyl modification radical SAM/GNAT enzyme Elp3 [Candidatus Woesearchaeota archaeon]
MMKKEYYSELISELKKRKNPDKDQIAKLKRKLARKHDMNRFPTDIEIFLNAEPEDIKFLKKLQTKPTRSLSGVAVVAVMTKPFKCPHGRCAICPGGPDSAFGDVPQSYTGKEPATMRAMRAGFDPYMQVFNRLEQYVVSGHVPDKVELIIMGGTFPSFSKRYQDDFVKYCFKAMNDFSGLFLRKGEIDMIKFKKFFELPGEVGDPERTKKIQARLKKLKTKADLEKEQRKNEKSRIRCIGLTIETRPDYAGKKEADEMLRLGCTRVELGVQSVYDDLLDNIERGHSVKDSIDATRLLKDQGFKINYHYMLGLPESEPKKDLLGLKELFSRPEFRPDMLKIYPCMVMKGTKLYKQWKKGRFKALTTRQAADIITEFKKHCPEYVRIMRVQRDIPTYATEAGVDRTNLRQLIQEEMKKKGIKCRCIRCREIGRMPGKGREVIRTFTYEASGGREFFISAVKGDALMGFCRMRFPSAGMRKEITDDSALIRELHVYGETAGVGETAVKGKIQHKGIGKRLLSEAENTAKRNGRKNIVVISGVGVRPYYRRLGYRKHGPYMVKTLKQIS